MNAAASTSRASGRSTASRRVRKPRRSSRELISASTTASSHSNGFGRGGRGFCIGGIAERAVVEMVSTEVPPLVPLKNDGGWKAPVLAAGRAVRLNVTSLASVPPTALTLIENMADWPAGIVCGPVGELMVKSLDGVNVRWNTARPESEELKPETM